MRLKIPRLGRDISEATLINVQLKKGQEVQKDNIILELKTDKGIIEIPSSKSGIILKVLVKSGDIVKQGQTIAILRENVLLIGGGSAAIVLAFVVGLIFIINTSKPKLNDKSDFNSQQEVVIEDQVEQKKEATEEIKKKIRPKNNSSVQKQKPVVKKETTANKDSSVQKQKSVKKNETAIKKEISATVLNYYKRGVKQIKSKQYKNP